MITIVKIASNKAIELGPAHFKPKAIFESNAKYADKTVTQHQTVLKSKLI
jgi:hypothetical protein